MRQRELPETTNRYSSNLVPQHRYNSKVEHCATENMPLCRYLLVAYLTVLKQYIFAKTFPANVPFIMACSAFIRAHPVGGEILGEWLSRLSCPRKMGSERNHSMSRIDLDH